MRNDKRTYRHVIDRLVDACRDGQGTIGPRRLRDGVWNLNATAESLPDQHAINQLLERLDDEDRQVVAGMLRDAFVSGVHETLVVLHDEQVPPFEEGYEGTPFHDFVGRLDGWPWP
jgi:hypothetical protein